jgi:hypothetical protein
VPVHHSLRLNGPSWIWRSGFQSLQAWQIAAITKPFQCFVHYMLFPYLFSARTEDVKMSDRSVNSRVGRNAALAAFAGLALVAASISPSAAASPAPARAAPSTVAGQGSSSATDFSAARRRHHYRRGPNAAGLAFMGMAAGLIGGAIAESRRQEYYDNYYYGGPRYYGPGYGYYGGPRYYNPY